MKKVDVRNIKFDPNVLKEEENALARLKENEAVYKIIHDDLELSTAEVKTYLGSLLDLEEDMNICACCPGLDACPKSHRAFCLKLGFVEGQLSRFYEPCQKKQTYDEMMSRFFIRDFDPSWMEEDLRRVDRAGIRETLLKEFRSIVKNESSRWLYVSGGHRQGKSYILALMAKDYGAIHHPAGFATTSKLIDNMKEKAIKEKEKFEKNMNLLQNAPLLVLDEFGNEYKSDFVFSSILYPLLSTRAKKNLPTWFTSDFKIDEIVDMYQGKIGNVRAKQFASLLKEHCKSEFILDGVVVY